MVLTTEITAVTAVGEGPRQVAGVLVLLDQVAMQLELVGGGGTFLQALQKAAARQEAAALYGLLLQVQQLQEQAAAVGLMALMLMMQRC
jgi:hypothetical protein